MKNETIILETSWEACRQIGGIFTFLKSRRRTMKARYGNNYFLVGPSPDKDTPSDFLPVSVHCENPAILHAVAELRKQGFELTYGCHISDQATVQVILFNLGGVPEQTLHQIKHQYWLENRIDLLNCSALVDQALLFGELLRRFVHLVFQTLPTGWDVLVHFHEWLSATALPALVNTERPVFTVFTTHATLLGRYLSHHTGFSRELLFQRNPEAEAAHFGIYPEFCIERNAARYAHALTTLSESAACECEVFLGRKPDYTIPNGIDPIYQDFNYPELAQNNRLALRNFLKGYFYPYYHLPVDNLVCLLASGRFEMQNKGFDVLLQALALLDTKLRNSELDIKVVLILVSAQDTAGLNPRVVESKSRYQEIQKISRRISTQVGGEVYRNVTYQGSHVLPDLNKFVDEESLVQWKRALQEFKRAGTPPLSTHLMNQPSELMETAEQLGLNNTNRNAVKLIYHPAFVHTANSPLGMDYEDLLSACDAGVFPGGYEPWGYAPLESVLMGNRTVLACNSGFAEFLINNKIESDRIHFVNPANRSQAAEELSEALLQVSIKSRYTRNEPQYNHTLVNKLDWEQLQGLYHEAYQLAATRKFQTSGLY